MSRIFSPTSFGIRLAVCFPPASMLMKIGAALPGIRSASSQYRWQPLPLSSVPSQIVLFVLMGASPGESLQDRRLAKHPHFTQNPLNACYGLLTTASAPEG